MTSWPVWHRGAVSALSLALRPGLSTLAPTAITAPRASASNAAAAAAQRNVTHAPAKPLWPLIEGRSGRLWEPVIGLEVHAQIASPTKLFSPASANLSESDGPNSNVSVIDAAFPGVLPTLQRDCVNHAITAALALSSTINMRSSFDRKHYFYPDLPAGFQITQRENPIARGGKLLVDLLDGLAYEKEIRILQIQLEQDSGKTVDSFSGTLVDLNRAGVGVLEIVTEADIRSADEALAFMRKMQRLLWHNKISSPEMDEGAWRCDVNVSVREYGSDRLGSKTEMKHISKFSTVRGAIEFEIGRQIDLLESGERVSQETRGVDDKTHSTFRLRGKEDSPDYRYMPEPDLPLLLLNEEMIENVRLSMVESLDKRRRRLMADYSLPSENVEILMAEPMAVEYFEKLAAGRDEQMCYNWLTSNLFGALKKRLVKLSDCVVNPNELGALVDLVDTGTLSGIKAKHVLELMLSGDRRPPYEIAYSSGWLQSNDDGEITRILNQLFVQHPKVVQEIKNGKTRKMKFFSGEVMRATKGRANPHLVESTIRELLGVGNL